VTDFRFYKSELLCVNILHIIIRWVEEDPIEILQTVKTCIEKAVENLKTLNVDPNCIKGLLSTSDMLMLNNN